MQAYSVLSLTQQATATIAEKTFVGFGGVTATAGGNSLGVSRADAESGDYFAVDALGTAVVITGGAIAITDEIEVGAGGTAVVKTTGAMVARPLQPASAAGKQIEVLLIQN